MKRLALMTICGRGRIRIILVMVLVATFGLGLNSRYFKTTDAHAQDFSIDQSDLAVPQAIATPPPPCAPGPGGACPVCTSKVPGESPYEATLPVPMPKPGFDYVVQLVNESSATILAAANAPNQGSAMPGGPVPPPVPVEPREGTWVMHPKGAPNWPDGSPGNTLTIDIPVGWENTKCTQANPNCGANGPRFYLRTGCNYSIAHNLAQCETGSCGDAYDCGMQAVRTPPESDVGRTPVSIVEWTFNSQAAQGYEYPDISLVDGVSLTIDVQALGRHCASRPGAPTDPNWLSQNQPLGIHGVDLREASRCIPSFQLTRGEVGQIVQGGGGNPNDVVACFTNCGRYEYPSNPGADCDPDTNPACKYWKDFCCFTSPGDPDHIYGGTCSSDLQCTQGGGCWDLPLPVGSTCACRAFIKQADCSAKVCTHPNPPDFSSQPPFGHCSDVTGNPASDDPACIGDDTVHEVFPGGYTWPNDPQTYSSDARAYRIIFAPGGTTVPITKSVTPVQSCSSLPESIYGYKEEKMNCSGVVGALFAGAAPAPACDPSDPESCPVVPGSSPPSRFVCNPGYHRCDTWSCSIADGGPVTTGTILCQWPKSAKKK